MPQILPAAPTPMMWVSPVPGWEQLEEFGAFVVKSACGNLFVPYQG